MKKLWIPGIIMLMLFVVAACSSGADPTPIVIEKEIKVIETVVVEKQVVVEKEVIVERKDPKILRISTNFVPGNFNTMNGGTPKEFVWSVMSVLVKADPSAPDGLKGDLAERWEVSPDGSSYTFFLRKNAMWHDGEPVTAHDVAWTYKMLMNPATGSRSMGKLALIKGGAAYSAGDTNEVEGIVVLDDHTIRFDQEFPNGLFMAEAGTTFERSILPKHILGDVPPDELQNDRFFFDSPVGSGPFMLERYVDGQFFRMVAFDDYYLGKPMLDEIIVSVILSSEAAQIAFQRGEIHSMSFDGGSDAATEMFQDAIDDPGTNIAAEDGSTLISYAFNTCVPDLIDPRVRQAFLYALDRQKLIDTFVGGNGKIFNSFMTHGWYQMPEWKDRYPFDPDKARELLKEAGWDSNREVVATIITVGSEEARAMLAAEQSMLADVGFKLTFKEVALQVWVDTFYETNEWDMIRVTFGVFGDPDGFLNFHVKTGSKNAMGYANPELDAKIEKGRRTISLEERKAIYQEINEEMLTTLPLAPVYLKDFWTIVSRKWYVPGIMDMRPATSLSDMPTFPIVAKHGEVFMLSPHLWDLRAAP